MKYLSLVVVIVVVSISVWLLLPDYSRRGQVVQVSNITWGYILSEDNSWLRHRKVCVIYPTTTGEWIEHRFPIEVINPFPIIRMK